MTTAIVARRVRAEAARICRTEPPGVRAVLPFDPDDPEDFQCWAQHTELTAPRPDRYRGTDAFVLQSLLWKVKDEIKKARRQMPRDEHKRLKPVSDISSLDEDKHPPSIRSDLPWNIREFAEVAAVAAYRYSVSSDGLSSNRRAMAALTCLGRLIACMREVVEESSVERFVEIVIAEPGYRRLAVGDPGRDDFLLGLRRLKNTGNQRQDLNAAGLHCPGPEQWTAFLRVLKGLWVGEDLAGFGLDTREAA